MLLARGETEVTLLADGERVGAATALRGAVTAERDGIVERFAIAEDVRGTDDTVGVRVTLDTCGVRVTDGDERTTGAADTLRCTVAGALRCTVVDGARLNTEDGVTERGVYDEDGV